MTDTISLLLVDDNPAFLRILADFLETHHRHEVTVVGTAEGSEDGMARARALQPQVVLLDLAMPDITGLKALPRLRRMLPEAGIIALSLLDPGQYQEWALAAGADAFVSKRTMTTDLLPAVRRVAQLRPGREGPAGGRAREGHATEEGHRPPAGSEGGNGSGGPA